MNIEIVLGKNQDEALIALGEALVLKGFERVELGQDTVFIGPHELAVRAVLKRNLSLREDDWVRLITDDPAVIRIVSEKFVVDNIVVR